MGSSRVGRTGVRCRVGDSDPAIRCRLCCVAGLRFEVETPPTTDPLSLVLSPDGRKLVFVADWEGVSRLWLRTSESIPCRDRRDRAGRTSMVYCSKQHFCRARIGTGVGRKAAARRETQAHRHRRSPLGGDGVRAAAGGASALDAGVAWPRNSSGSRRIRVCPARPSAVVSPRTS